MIAIDTNVLLRYLLQDDLLQSKKADKITSGKIRILRALNLFRNAEAVEGGAKKRRVDFADTLIYEKSKYLTNKLGENFVGFYTFDTAAQQFPDVLIP